MTDEQGRRLGQSPVAKTDDHAAVGDAVLALTELRGWALGGKGGVLNVDNAWLLERIDRALVPFGVLDIVRGIHHDHMEGV